MCGITGILNFDKEEIDETVLKNMCISLKHRGPDDYGIYFNQNIGLGHTRLSIVDLSKAGHQPMCNENETIWITFNGEIYNFQKIKNYLEKKGHKFKSHTDTEVIIHAYEEFGERCVKFFNGMFAFAIWDSNKKELFLARDRTGQKPLYFYKKNETFIFASEIKAIEKHHNFEHIINYDSVSNFLTFDYIPHPQTIYKNCYKLNPAHYLIIKQNKIIIKKYWDIKYKEEKQNEQFFIKKIPEIIENSVKKRLMSDVPVGVFLSGGIDSSIITHFAAKHNPKINTYSLGFDNDNCNETKYAKLISESVGTNHKELFMKSDINKELLNMCSLFDEPFGDPASIPLYYLSKYTKNNITVALSGDGGDENFGGYSRYLHHIINNKNSTNKINNSIRWNKKELDKSNILKSSFPSNISSLNILKKYENSKLNTINEMTYFDLKHYIPDCINTKTDISGMSNSIEIRSPFLDHQLIQFCATIPSTMKISNNTTKYILKKSLKNILPKEIILRKKMGFHVPFREWIDSKEVSNIIFEKKSFSNMYFKIDKIKKIIEQKNKQNYRFIWNLINLENWFENNNQKLC